MNSATNKLSDVGIFLTCHPLMLLPTVDRLHCYSALNLDVSRMRDRFAVNGVLLSASSLRENVAFRPVPFSLLLFAYTINIKQTKPLVDSCSLDRGSPRTRSQKFVHSRAAATRPDRSGNRVAETFPSKLFTASNRN